MATNIYWSTTAATSPTNTSFDPTASTGNRLVLDFFTGTTEIAAADLIFTQVGSGTTATVRIDTDTNRDGTADASSKSIILDHSDSTKGLFLTNLTTTTTTALGNVRFNDESKLVVGTGTLTGGFGDDQLIGSTSADTLDGKSGNDKMVGGAGNDIYYVDSASDVVTETGATGAANGIDTIISTATIAALATNVENLTLGGTTAISGTGNSLNNTIIGNSKDNTLTGGTGDDVLIGGAGNDTLDGGANTTGVGDTVSFVGTTVAVSVNLGAASNQASSTATGTDTISNVENVIGGSSGDTITGDGNNNTIEGGLGNDTLDGGAGTGDTLSYVSSTAKITISLGISGPQNTNVTGTGAAGTDTVSNFENLTGGAGDDTLTGSNAANTIIGGAGNDTLKDGWTSGSAVDTLKGGLGNDTYEVNLGTAIVSEDVSQGIDLVKASVTYAISDSDVENLTLTLTGASPNIDGTGNSAANVITGNTGTNTLDGKEGTDTLWGDDGADTLKGGDGVDTMNGDLASSTDTTVDGSNDSLQGQKGDDIITLGKAGTVAVPVNSGHDTLIFEDTAANNGKDIINNFIVSSATDSDKLDFNAFFGAATSIALETTAATGTPSASPVDISALHVLQVSSALSSGSNVAALFGDNTGGTPTAVFQDNIADTGAGTTGDEKYVVISAGSSGAASVWFVSSVLDGDDTDISAADVQLVGVLNGVNHLDTTPFVQADNIVA